MDLDIVELRLSFLETSQNIDDYKEWIGEFAKPLMEEIRKLRMAKAFLETELQEAQSKIEDEE